MLCEMLHKRNPHWGGGLGYSLCIQGWVGYMRRDGEADLATLPFGVFDQAIVDDFMSKWQVCDFTIKIFVFNLNFSDLFRIFRI